jgi:hypothetical protein
MGILGCKARRLTISEIIDHTVVIIITPAIGELRVRRLLKCGEAPGLPLRPRIGLEGHHHRDQRVAEMALVEHP